MRLSFYTNLIISIYSFYTIVKDISYVYDH